MYRSSCRVLCLSVLTACLLVLPLLGPVAGPALAQLIPIGGEFRVNSYTDNNQIPSAMAMAPDGRFVVAWTSFTQDGGDYGIYAQRYAADGTARGAELRANTTTAGSQVQPAVAMAVDGRFVVTWASNGQDGSGYGVYAQRYAADGTSQGAELRVNTTTANDQDSPAVAMAADGRLVVTWTSNGQDGSGYGVYAQRYAADGTLQGAELRVNTTTANAQRDSVVAMAADGRFVVVWVSGGQDGSGLGVYGQRYAADGTPQGGEFLVNTYTASDQALPAVAMAGDGRFVVTWTSNGQDGSSYGVYAQRYAADGTPQGAELRVNTYTASDQAIPAVAMAGDGRFVVTWTSNGEDGSGWGVYAQRYAADGTPQGAEFRVNTYTANDQDSPVVAMAADGLFVVAWSSYAQEGSGTEVYAQRYLVNEPPVVGLAGGALAYVEGSDPRSVDGAATVTDVDSPNFGGGALTIELQGGLAEDRLGLQNQGTGTGQIGVAGSTVSYGGTPVGTVSAGGLPLVVLLNEQATPAATQALLRAVTYENMSQNPSSMARTVRVTLSDGDGETSAPATRAITIGAVNQPPTAQNDGFTVSSPALTVPAPGVLANDTDPDSPTITAQVVAGPSAGALTLQTDGGFTYTPNAGYQGTDRFTYRASDGAASSGEATVTLSGTATACLPRPRVTTTPVAGGGTLQVTIAATPLNGPSNNLLREIRFGDPALGVADPQNARIILGGQAHTDRFSYTVPPNTVAVSFTLERVTPGQPTTVFLAITDGCGTWKTFVGGGTGAGF